MCSFCPGLFLARMQTEEGQEILVLTCRSKLFVMTDVSAMGRSNRRLLVSCLEEGADTS